MARGSPRRQLCLRSASVLTSNSRLGATAAHPFCVQSARLLALVCLSIVIFCGPRVAGVRQHASCSGSPVRSKGVRHVQDVPLVFPDRARGPRGRARRLFQGTVTRAASSRAAAAPADAAVDASSPSDVPEGFAELSEADRAAALAQKICPVSGDELGEMGTPIKVSVNGRDVFLCCPSCKEPLLKPIQRSTWPSWMPNSSSTNVGWVEFCETHRHLDTKVGLVNSTHPTRGLCAMTQKSSEPVNNTDDAPSPTRQCWAKALVQRQGDRNPPAVHRRAGRHRPGDRLLGLRFKTIGTSGRARAPEAVATPRGRRGILLPDASQRRPRHVGSRRRDPQVPDLRHAALEAQERRSGARSPKACSAACSSRRTGCNWPASKRPRSPIGRWCSTSARWASWPSTNASCRGSSSARPVTSKNCSSTNRSPRFTRATRSPRFTAPRLYTAARELLIARSGQAAPYLDASRKKLELLGLADEEIDEIIRTGKVSPAIVIRSPHSGHVFEKRSRRGRPRRGRTDAVRSGRPVDRVDRGRTLRKGCGRAPARANGRSRRSTPIQAGCSPAGSACVHPHVETATRTLRVRCEVDNPNHELRPGMFATLRFKTPIVDTEPFRSELAADHELG